MRNQFSTRLIILLSIGVAASIVPSSVSANPIVAGDPHFLSQFAILVLVANFPINLFCCILALLIGFKKLGMKIGDIPIDFRIFTFLILIATFMITLAGVVIDYLFIIRGVQYYVGNFDIFSLTAGVILIFASVFGAFFIVLHIKIRPSIFAGIIFTIVNLFFWMIQLIFGLDMILELLLPMIFFILAIIFFSILTRWHGNT